MKALYRKYRPLHLSDVIGQDQIIKQLQGTLSQGKISHAYLFVGPRGCGKTSVARIFAHEINHFDYQLEDSYIDIVEIDAATFTSVENIRELREKAMIMPTLGKYKVYIIDEVHMLSNSAFNALLKILEEPPEHIIFIMATTNPEKIPATITSRTQIYHFSLAEPAVMQDFLKKISEKEGIKITDNALQIITERGGGSFRDSLSILDQIATINSKETTIEANEVAAILGLPKHQDIKKLISSYEDSDTSAITHTLSDLLNFGITAESITIELIQQILKHPTPKTLRLIEQLFSVTGNFLEAKLTVALISSSNQEASSQDVDKRSFVPPKPSDKNTSQWQHVSNTDSKTTNSADSTSSTQPAGPFSKIRDQLVKNAKNHKAEHTTPIKEVIEDLPETPPTLPEAVVDTAGDFNFNGFISNISNLNPPLISTLKKSSFQISQNTLEIYPEKSVYWEILSKKNNLEILKNATSPVQLIIKNPETDTIPKSAISFEQAISGETRKDTTSSKLTKLSAIMGEVKEVNDNPF